MPTRNEAANVTSAKSIHSVPHLPAALDHQPDPAVRTTSERLRREQAAADPAGVSRAKRAIAAVSPDRSSTSAVDLEQEAAADPDDGARLRARTAGTRTRSSRRPPRLDCRSRDPTGRPVARQGRVAAPRLSSGRPLGLEDRLAVRESERAIGPDCRVRRVGDHDERVRAERR